LSRSIVVKAVLRTPGDTSVMRRFFGGGVGER
jgi:hypothetical protein